MGVVAPAVCQQNHGHFVFAFKEGRTPDLWQGFQALLTLCPEQKRVVTLPDNTRRVYRRVEALLYTDSENRVWTLGAILCEETSPMPLPRPTCGGRGVSRPRRTAPGGELILA